MNKDLQILKNPYDEPVHAEAIFKVLDSYASDVMGGSKSLGPFTRDNLVKELKRRDWIVTFLAVLEDEPVGLLIAMEGFSTFAALPLMNIHDVAVVPGHRGKGIGKALFDAVEAEAKSRKCCKLTLEVLSGNTVAMGLYDKLGFRPYELDPEAGTAQFWDKSLLD
ncbi:MAG: GNAT family N-acetyltransferase [Puniceicoccaceae bacterium]